MKASRAYITGLGTTGVLLGFALLLLIVVSAILSFRGWPGGDAAGGGSVVRIDEDSSLTRLTPVRFEGASAPAERAGVPAGGGRAAGARRSASDDGGVRGTGMSGGEESLPAGTQAAPSAGHGQPAAAPSAPGDVGGIAGGVTGTTESVAGATQGVTGQVTEALGGAQTPLGQAVTGAGETVSGVVEQTGDTAGRSLPKLP